MNECRPVVASYATLLSIEPARCRETGGLRLLAWLDFEGETRVVALNLDDSAELVRRAADCLESLRESETPDP